MPVNRSLFHAKKGEVLKPARKRKTKAAGAASDTTLDLNLPPVDATALIPAGLVHARVSQLAVEGEGTKDGSEELLKKQRRLSTSFAARSAAAADGSPRRAQ
jgi:hypothetical protein